MAEHTLASIVASGLCTGCGACSAVLPPKRLSMVMDSKGFLRPQPSQALAPAEEQAVRDVCPGIGLAHPPGARPLGVDYHPVWGPVVSVAAGHALDQGIRRQASSGGVLSALLIHLLETRQVDFVVHIRAATDDPLRNDAVISTTRDEVALGAGSRYAPAAPVAMLPQALVRPGRFAFVGKPCDVAAVRKMMARDPGLVQRIPFLLSFMCAGTPSLQGTHEVLQRLGMPAEQVVRFRYRGDGWPGLTRADAADGRSATMDYNTSWGSILNRYLQPRCKLCADGTGEFADLVCADAWYGKDGYPDFAEQEGRSLVIARTAAGQALLMGAVTAVAVSPFDVTELRVIQPYQFYRKGSMISRLAALRLLGKVVPDFGRLELRTAALQMPLLRLLKEFVGTLRRSVAGRI